MTDSYNLTCIDNDTTVKVQVVAGISVFLGLCNICLGALVVTFIFLLKRHRFHSQRLVLYLSISVILAGIKSAIDFHAFVEPIQETSMYCRFCGLLQNYANSTLTFAVFVMTVDTFLYVTFNVNTSTAKMDVVEVLFIYVLPVLWLWIPLLPMFNVYGSNAVECNLIRANYSTCETKHIGIHFDMFMVIIPSFIIIGTMIVLYIVTLVLLHRRVNAFEGRYNPQYRIVKLEKIKRAKYLLINPVLYIFFSLLFLVVRIVQTLLSNQYIAEVGIFSILALNFRNLSLLVAYTFQDRDTCTQIRYSKLVSACAVCFCRSDPVRDYHDAVYVDYGDSLDSAVLEKRKCAKSNSTQALIDL